MKKRYSITSLFTIILFNFTFVSIAQDWVQIGSAISGEAAGDAFGHAVSLSYNGDKLALGAPDNSDNGQYLAGHVRVFSWNGSAWTQLGGDIDGEAAGYHAGFDVSISGNGSTIALGAILAIDTNNMFTGYLRVYNWSGTSWVQKGNNLYGIDPGEEMGKSVALNYDGNRVAGGAPYRPSNYANGAVTVWEWNGSAWNVLGSPIMGDDYYEIAGFDVSLDSLGNTLAIGSPSKEDSAGVTTGAVRVFNWNGSTWNLKGTMITGSFATDFFGRTVSLSADGNTLAVGASDNNVDKGYVRIYDWNGTDWVQRGSNIEGELSGDHAGKAISLSPDGNTIAVGAPRNDNSGQSAGQMRVFYWNGTTWAQRGNSFNGSGADNVFGAAVAVTNDGMRLAVGAPRNSDAGYLAGQVKVYHYSGIGSSENSFQQKVFTYPNPTSDLIYVDLDEYKSPVTLSLYDLTGKLILESSYAPGSKGEMLIKGPPGVYLLKITQDKEIRRIERIIKL